MKAVNFKQIEAFVTVADLGSFRRAASRLNTTQPNISNRIAQLETRLGVRLMERDAGSVRLTTRGRALLIEARAVLAAVDGFIARAEDGALFEGVLRLGVSELVAHTWLRDFMREMRAAFPSVDVELTVDLSARLSDALFDRELDLAFQSGPFERTAPGTVALCASAYQWVASPALGLPSRTLQTSDLAAHPVLTHARGTAPFAQLQSHFSTAEPRVRLVPSSNIGACLQMTVDGLGIACLPAAMLRPYLGDGRLALLDYRWTPAQLEFAARTLLDPAPSFLRGAIDIAARLSPTQDNNPLS
jgi:DNA-binding transcriptional LysR family regulator